MEFATVLLAAVSIIVLYAAHHAILLWRFIKRVEKIPTAADCLPVVGHALKLATPRNHLLDVIGNILSRSEPLCKIWLGPVPFTLFIQPRHLEIILGNTKHINKTQDYDYMMSWLGNGLLTSKGSKWQYQRKMLTPTFHFKILDNFVDIFSEKSEILVQKLRKEAGSQSFNIYPYITRCALDIICETAMGTQLNAQEQKESEYVDAVCKITDEIFYRMLSPWLYPDVIHMFTPNGRRLTKYINILHDFTNKVIRERKQLYKNLKKETSEENVYLGMKNRMAFLDLLLEISEKSNKLTDEEIREQVDTFMFEGHDTTTAGMGWALQKLGAHPEYLEKAYEEQNSIFQGSNRAPTMKDLNEMKYLERVIKETLRLHPSVPIIARELAEDLEIDGMTLPAGMRVAVVFYFTHRLAEHFPDPEKFNPDNFLPERIANRHPYAYVPFSAGPRNCIGQKFALLEEKSVLSYVIRNFKLEAVGETPVGLPELVLRPENGVQLKLTPRS